MDQLRWLQLLILMGMLPAVVMGWGNGCLWLLNNAALKISDSPIRFGRIERLYFSAIIGTGILSMIMLLIGILGGLYPIVASIIALSGLTLFAVLERPKRILVPSLSATTIILLSLCGLSLFLMLVVSAWMPPIDWDVLAYHFALPKLYIEAHRIIYVPYIVHSNWPMNVEMLFTWTFLLGDELLAQTVTWWFVVGISIGVMIIGRKLFQHTPTLLLALIVLYTPIVIRLSGTGMIDLGVAFFSTAALVAYCYYHQEKQIGWLVLLAISSGFAAGCKLPGVLIPLLFGFLIITDNILVLKQKKDHFFLLGGVSFLLVLPWYLRSYVNTGNPVWPFLYNLFGGRNWDVLGDYYHTNSLNTIWSVVLPSSWQGVLQSFYYLFFRPSELGGFWGFGQPLLFLVLCGFILAMIFYRRTPFIILQIILFSISYYLIWFFVLGRQNRFLIGVLPMFVVLSTFAIDKLLEIIPIKGRIWAILLLSLGILYYSPLTNNSLLATARQHLRIMFNNSMRHDWLSQKITPLYAFEWMNENLPSDSNVLLLPYENRGYYLNRHYIWGNPISQRLIQFEKFHTSTELAEKLHSLGVTYVLENPEWLYTDLIYWEDIRALMLDLEEECGTVIWQKEKITIYRLGKCRHE